eukprot:1140933-Pelagomonas_calceolata.AAC.14
MPPVYHFHHLQAGVLKGMGYIEFSSVDEKNKAWELNGSEIAGGNLYVDGNVKPRTPGGDFGGGGRGGRGGRGGECVAVGRVGRGGECKAAIQCCPFQQVESKLAAVVEEVAVVDEKMCVEGVNNEFFVLIGSSLAGWSAQQED